MGNSKAALEFAKDHCLDVSIKTLQKWGQLGLPSCAFARGAGLQSHVGHVGSEPVPILACCNSRRCGQQTGEVEFDEDFVGQMVSNKDGNVAWLLQLEPAQSVFGKGRKTVVVAYIVVFLMYTSTRLRAWMDYTGKETKL